MEDRLVDLSKNELAALLEPEIQETISRALRGDREAIYRGMCGAA